MNQQSTNTNDQEIAQLQSLAKEESDMINRWYQIRYNHFMEELNRLNEVYNERMAHHSMQWAERLTNLYMKKEIQRMNVVEEGGIVSQNNMLPMPVLERHPNIIFPQETDDNFIRQPFVSSILSLNTMAIVSDDDDDLLLQNPFHNQFDTDDDHRANMADIMEIDDNEAENEESNAMEIV